MRYRGKRGLTLFLPPQAPSTRQGPTAKTLPVPAFHPPKPPFRTVFFALILIPSLSLAQQLDEWYPYQPGTSWVYQKEALEGDMRHPDFERWTTEETIVSAVNDPVLGGIVVTKRIKVTSNTFSPKYDPVNDHAKQEPKEERELIRQNCVYSLDDIFGNDVAGGKVPADFCFPMAQGGTWGRLANTSPAEEFVWRVKGVNADPYGAPGATTFHVGAHAGSGTYIDEWFAKGIGLLQAVTLHHGTYDEGRQILLKATINGKTRTFDLKRARLTPLSEYDCEGSIWRYFARADGNAFQSRAACVEYATQVNH